MYQATFDILVIGFSLEGSMVSLFIEIRKRVALPVPFLDSAVIA